MAKPDATVSYKGLTAVAGTLFNLLKKLSTKYLIATDDAPLQEFETLSIRGVMETITYALVRVTYAALDEPSAQTFLNGMKDGVSNWAARGLSGSGKFWADANNTDPGTPKQRANRYGPGGHAPTREATQSKLHRFRHDELEAMAVEAKNFGAQVAAYESAMALPPYGQVVPLANILAAFLLLVKSTVALSEANVHAGASAVEDAVSVVKRAREMVEYEMHPARGRSISHAEMAQVGGIRVNPHHNRR